MMSWGTRWSATDAHPVASVSAIKKKELPHRHVHTTNLCISSHAQFYMRYKFLVLIVKFKNVHTSERTKQGSGGFPSQQRLNLALTRAADRNGA